MCCPVIVPKKSLAVNNNGEIIFLLWHILSGRIQRGGEYMEENKEEARDIDDLIFADEESQPSQR